MAINLETLQIQFEIRDNTGSKLKKLQRQLAGMEVPEIDADTEKAEKKIKDLKKSAQDVDAEVEVEADTKDAQNKIKSVEKSAQNIKGGEIGISADARNALDKIDSVQTAAQGMKGAEIGISADNRDAVKDIESVQQMVEDIPDAPKITPEVDTSKAESSLKGLWNMMKALGLLKLGKEIFDFGMSTVNEAYADQAVQNQLANIGGTAAMDRIYSFTGEMNEKFGLNETGLAEMAKNFTAVYKGTGLDLDAALDKGIEMARYAVDYASALDKTPGEIADIFMSVLKGNTEVADSASIYGLTADAMDSKIAEITGLSELQKKMAEADETQFDALKAQIEILEADIEKNAAMYKALAFFEIMKENADVKMGFTGDWERTFGEYGNQRTVLGEQWQTLKQEIGTFLTPAATEATTALNDLLQSLTGWVGKLNESSFVSELSDYFGTAEMSKEEQQRIIDGIVGPVKGINEQLSPEISALEGTLSSYKSAYSTMMQILKTFYGTGKIDDEQLAAAYEDYLAASEAALQQSEQTLITMFTAYTGTDEQWAELAAAGVAGITAYYDAMSKTLEEKHAAFKDLLDQAMADGAISREEMGEITSTAQENAKITLEASQISYGARTQMYLDDLYKSGEFSAKTVDELFSGAKEAAKAEREQMEFDYDNLRLKIYEVAEWNRREYEKDPAAYIAEYGAAPLTAAEMLAGAQAEYDRKLAQMDADLVNQISRFLIGGIENIGAKITPGMDFGDFLDQVAYPMEQFASLVVKISSGKSQGLDLGPEALSILNFYDSVMWEVNRTLQEGTYEFSPDDPAVAPGGWVIGGANLFPSIPQSDAIYAGMTASLGELDSAIDSFGAYAASFPERIVVESHAHLNIGGYEFGQVVTESMNTYNTSAG